MRFRVPLLALLFVVSSLVLPLVAHAGIPFFGPIIPDGYQSCPAGWGALMIVVNNVIQLLITLAIVLVAPLMIAWAGFLLVVNPFNAGAKEQAKKILTNTILGIVIALAGWMIVNALMVVLYNPSAASGTTRLGTWYSLVVGSGDFCLKQAGAPHQAGIPTPPPTVAVVCSVTTLPPPPTDALGAQMEGGQTVIWAGTNSQLQACANKFTGLVGGGSVTSAYRPQSYQTHLWEIRDRWCTQGLQSNSNTACSQLKNTVSAEVAKHFKSPASAWSCGAVAQLVSTHGNPAGASIGVDISFPSTSGISHGSPAVLAAASQSCLLWPNHTGDPYHYDLKLSCTC